MSKDWLWNLESHFPPNIVHTILTSQFISIIGGRDQSTHPVPTALLQNGSNWQRTGVSASSNTVFINNLASAFSSPCSAMDEWNHNKSSFLEKGQRNAKEMVYADVQEEKKLNSVQICVQWRTGTHCGWARAEAGHSSSGLTGRRERQKSAPFRSAHGYPTKHRTWCQPLGSRGHKDEKKYSLLSKQLVSHDWSFLCWSLVTEFWILVMPFSS